MPYIGQTGDLTNQYNSLQRAEDDFRPASGLTFSPGLFCQISPIDKQNYPDQKTVQLVPTGASGSNAGPVAGAVSDTFNGFALGSTSYVSPSSASTVRGTPTVQIVTAGFHPAVQIDQSYTTSAKTIVDGSALLPAFNTAGAAQGGDGVALNANSAVLAIAVLPSTGIGHSIASAALVQASQTATIGGTPAVGDTLSVTIQTPYVDSAPGVAQTTTWTTAGLTSAQATSTTTAAAALVAYLNAQPSFSKFFTASNASAVVTITVNALATPFYVNFGSGSTVTGSFSISLSGSVGNSLTFATAATGGSTNTAGGANLASGAGFKGTIPAVVL